MRPTTPEEFRRFQQVFLAWQRRLSCEDFTAVFRLAELTGCWAQVEVDLTGRIATVELTATVDPAELFDVGALAKHEALHLLISRVTEVGKQRYTTERELNEAEEGVVHVLERLIA